MFADAGSIPADSTILVGRSVCREVISLESARITAVPSATVKSFHVIGQHTRDLLNQTLLDDVV